MLLGEAYDKANELHAAHVPDQMTSGRQSGVDLKPPQAAVGKSLHLDSRILNDLRPFGAFCSDQRGRLFRSIRATLEAEGSQPFFHVCKLNQLCNLTIEKRKYIVRRSGWCNHPEPRIADDVGQTRFTHGRNLRQCGQSDPAGHRQPAQTALVHLRHRARRRAEGNGRVAAESGSDGGACAIERNVDEIKSERGAEELGREMRCRADAG